MTLQSAIDDQLPFLRAEARARMRSTATVRRKTGRSAQDEETGRQVPVWAVVHTDVPVRVVASRVGGASHRVQAAGVEQELATPRLDFEWDLENLADGDLVDVTAGESAGTVYRVIEATKGDQRTARRVPAEETPRPTEWTP